MAGAGQGDGGKEEVGWTLWVTIGFSLSAIRMVHLELLWEVVPVKKMSRVRKRPLRTVSPLAVYARLS